MAFFVAARGGLVVGRVRGGGVAFVVLAFGFRGEGLVFVLVVVVGGSGGMAIGSGRVLVFLGCLAETYTGFELPVVGGLDVEAEHLLP